MSDAPEETRGADAPELIRTRQLFRFLKAFAERRTPLPRTLSSYPWMLRLRDLPEHPSITIGEVVPEGAPGDDRPDGGTPLVRVERPQLTRAPRPPELLAPHLTAGWESAEGEVQVHPARNIVRDGETVTERFEDDPARVAALAEWKTRWESWAMAERPALKAMRIFERLYELRGRIERESEQLELVVGDGRLRWQRSGGTIDHPILLQRVELHFDPHAPAFEVLDAERGPELYSAVIAEDSALSPAQLDQMREELEQESYHPLMKDAASGYLRRLAQLLSARGGFAETAPDGAPGPDPVVSRDPVLFLRTRPSGYAAAFDRVLADLEVNTALPVSLTRLVGVEPPLPEEPVEQASSPWGEPTDVLLSKPANAEQVQIARALDRHRAVLVQGPPGTGKSHTIANLIGHLAAQGKRVLVTSHTSKALRVLRDQVVDTLQPLCVAVLDSDAESRAQMEQSVRGILSRLMVADEDKLQREADELGSRRVEINQEIDRITGELHLVRQAEYRPIIVDGESVDPAEAARYVRDRATGNDWVPGPLDAGAPLPLSDAELRELYASNAGLTPTEDAEITGRLPDPALVPTPQMFSGWIDALRASEPAELAAFWNGAPVEEGIPAVAKLATLVEDASADLNRMEDWQRAIVAAGHAGGSERDLWVQLGIQVNSAFEVWERARPVLLEREVALAPSANLEELRRAVKEMGVHVSHGRKFWPWTLLRNKPWKAVLRDCRVEGKLPSETADFRAIATQIEVDQSRSRLHKMWSRKAQPAGLPAFEELGATPEAVLREYASQFSTLLEWWPERWAAIEAAASAAGFRWAELRGREVARSVPLSPFERDARIFAGPLREAVSVRLATVRAAAAKRLVGEVDSLLARHQGKICAAVRAALRDRDVQRYEHAYGALHLLAGKEAVWRRRRELSARLAHAAPEWARAVHQREAPHETSALPGDARNAWRWRQLQQEIERRAQLDEISLARRLSQRQLALRQTTADLIDRRAWSSQLRRTNLQARLALQGWADTVRRIGRGTGRRAPVLQAEARRLLTRARDAVPVWIMPLSRVAENFDPAERKFDVVILDEASQSDVTGLLAWYLGERVAVVGDHEQVSPLAVGQDLDTVSSLIVQHLAGVPNSHLYDGRTSVYDLARQSFGGTIALREHFRCVPDIIGFSNELCYNFEIRPLRAPGSAPRPHVVEYVVSPALSPDRSGKANLAEARSVVALLKAITEEEQYRDKTVGAITLLGDEQAQLIQELAVGLVGAIELDRRRFLAGNSAQFQGDERNIIFLSMVDTPGPKVLRLSQQESSKQRYNVAASRAKDQLWLVHSLDPNRDLQPNDLRRRLIEYVRDPGAARRAREEVVQRADSPFEVAVAERLIAAGYRVQPQVSVGNYRIDMVVSDSANQAAVECDGDRFHGFEQIPADMARQAVLERVGWQFIRIRGTRFYRDPDGAMEWVFQELRRLGIEPIGLSGSSPDAEADAAEYRDRVTRRAYEIMREQGWIDPFEDESPSSSVRSGHDLGTTPPSAQPDYVLDLEI